MSMSGSSLLRFAHYKNTFNKIAAKREKRLSEHPYYIGAAGCSRADKAKRL